MPTHPPPVAADAELAVQATGLGKRFVDAAKKPFAALDELNFSCARGQTHAIVGADGAGKTTLMRLMTGLMNPDSGSLNVLGFDSVRDARAIQTRISYMPQKFGLYEDLSIIENMNLYADLHGLGQERQARFDMLLTMTDLTRFTEREAGKLSGGMKQKLALACTLVRSPELLLLDEPSVGVDPLSRHELWRIIDTLTQQESLTTIIATTYLSEAQNCAHILMLHEGVLLAEGGPAELARKADEHTWLVSAPAATQSELMQAQSLLWQAPDTVDAYPAGGMIKALLSNAVATPPKLSGSLKDFQWQARTPDLQDAFMLLLRQHQRNTTPIATSVLPKNDSVAPSDQTHDTMIEVEHLRREFGDFVAVDDTTFSVKRGEVFGLLGPNGAGKTTTFRMLCGLLPPSGGKALVAGVDLRTASAQARAKLGYVAQKFSLYQHLSGLENLNFFGRAYGLFGRALHARITALEQEFALEGRLHAPALQLPGGYKQRLAMAAALIHEPAIMFLDEPTSGADTLARRQFWQRIHGLSQQGITIIVTTHFMEEAEYCSRIMIQDAGKVIALGTPLEVLQSAKDAAQNDPLLQASLREWSGQNADSPLNINEMDMEKAFMLLVQNNRQRTAAAA